MAASLMRHGFAQVSILPSFILFFMSMSTLSRPQIGRGGEPGVSPDRPSPFMLLKLEISSGYTDGERTLFRTGLSPWRRAHSL